MINIFFSLLVSLMLVINFSGKPAEKTPESKTTTVTPWQPFANDNDQIIWRPDRKLNWDDFLCKPVRNTDAVALTSTTLSLAYRIHNGEIDYKINCGFSKSRSWGLLKTDYILAHEQAHFDITELYARKLHQALTGHTYNKATPMQKQINAVYEAVMKEKEAYQERYDNETSHSRNKVKQTEWLDTIEAQLAETELYAAYH